MLKREDGHILRRVIDLEVEGHRKKWRRKQVEEECEGWLEKGRCTLPIKVECWCRSDCCLVEVNLATHT